MLLNRHDITEILLKVVYSYYFQFQKKLLSEFEIPEILKEELEKDYVSINRDDMVFYTIF
jgi:hypothetical protein